MTDIVREHLRERHVLLVLDNCEQVLDAAPSLAELLGACPDIKMLATSRESLRLRWESVFRVAPLALPNSQTDVARLRQVPAVALFVQRAQAADPTFALSDANGPAVSAIRARLDGLPLALELAAARISAIPPDVLVERLGSTFHLLRGPRDAPSRQQSLRAAIDWSYQLLAPAEQVLFRSLGIFTGDCTQEAVVAITAQSEKSMWWRGSRHW
jgi:predicted ATPase